MIFPARNIPLSSGISQQKIAKWKIAGEHFKGYKIHISWDISIPTNLWFTETWLVLHTLQERQLLAGQSPSKCQKITWY
jgi:hypothetical protein